jgi:hypothetical protein
LMQKRMTTLALAQAATGLAVGGGGAFSLSPAEVLSSLTYA